MEALRSTHLWAAVGEEDWDVPAGAGRQGLQQRVEEDELGGGEGPPPC